MEKNINEILQEASENDARETGFDRKKALKLYSERMTDSDIALEMGVNVAIVSMWRKECGFPEYSNKISAEPKEVKAADKWEKVRELYNQGMNDCKIAAEIGVSSNTIWIWRKKEGLPPNARSPRSPKTNKEVPAINEQEAVAKNTPETIGSPADFYDSEAVEQLKKIAELRKQEEELKKLNTLAPDSQIIELASTTLKIILKIWEKFGKEEIEK